MSEIFYSLKNDQVDVLKEYVESKGTSDFLFDAASNPKIPQILWNSPPILSVCAFLGSPKCFAFLINNKAGVNIADQSEDHLLPIHFSIAGKNMTYFKILLKKGSKNDRLIYFSIKFDVMPILDEILQQKQEEIKMDDLKYSIQVNKLYATKKLLDTGYMFTYDVIEYAKSLGNKEAVQLLQSHKEQILDVPLRHDNLLVQNAGMKGQLETVKTLILIEKKYKINDTDERGNTALIAAAKSGNIDILQFLASFPDIDLNHQNDGGRAAIHEAAYKGRSEALKFLLSLSGIDPLLKTSNGVPFLLYLFIFFVCFSNRDALHCAAKSGDIESVKLLLTIKGLSPNNQDNDGDTPLHIAANNKHVDIIHCFLDYPGVKFNIRNKGGVLFPYF